MADLSYTAAVEAATIALHDRLCDPNCRESLTTMAPYAKAAAALVDAVWPILHAAAYEAGRASILDGAREEWGVRSGEFVFAAANAQTARDRAARMAGYEPVVRYVTEWRPIEEASDGR